MAGRALRRLRARQRRIQLPARARRGKKFTGQLGAPSTLETVGKAKITCSAGTAHGEYTGAKTLTMTLTLSGCRTPERPRALPERRPRRRGRSVTNALEGELGFISRVRNTWSRSAWTSSTKPALATFECSDRRAARQRTRRPRRLGDRRRSRRSTRWSLASRVTYKATAGRQAPEQFESGLKDTLSTSVVSGLEKTVEQAGLTATVTITSEEPLEIKAKAI